MKKSMGVAATGLLAITALAGDLGPTGAVSRPVPSAAVPQTGRTFLDPFDGAPSAPEPFASPHWDVTVHSRENHGNSLEPTHAQHGPTCSAPPDEHMSSGFAEAVFSCKDHVMTAFNAGGYGLIYLTPDHLVDFSGGEAVVSFDVSTAKFSTRDWWDLWITPYEDHLQLTLDDVGFPDLQGAPRRAVHVSQIDFEGTRTGIEAQVYRDFERHALPMAGQSIESAGVRPSATDRTTFVLRISRTRLRVCIPSIEFCPINTRLDDLGWDRGVLQIGHHSYDPTKDDKFANPRPNTWHWDNVRISPAIPFSILHANRRVTYNASTPVRFDSTARGSSHLRFSGYTPNGETLEFSTDGGASWTAARRQPSSMSFDRGHHASYWTPIAAGTTQVNIRARGAGPGAPNGSDWYVRDISIFSGVARPPAQRARPRAPGRLATAVAPAAGVRSGQVRLSWAAPATGGTPIRDYVIQRSRPGGAWTTVTDGVSTARSFTVRRLRNGRLYRFRVAAVNNVGAGPFSAVATARPRWKPGRVEDLSAVRQGRSVRLRWSAPAANGAPIRDYVIQRKRNGRPWVTIRDGVSTTRSLRVGPLRRDSRYRFRVAARNVVGRGAFSAVVVIAPRR